MAALLGVTGAVAAQPPQAVAPASEHVERVWHFGRVTGDLERIIDFYQGALGLTLRGSKEQQLRYLTNGALDEFVDGPRGAQFRAVHFLLPGASLIADPAERISLEAFEYHGIPRTVLTPTLAQPGASNLRFVVGDLHRALAAIHNAEVISRSGHPYDVPTPATLGGRAQAVMVRDPDGYPIELMQIDQGAASLAAPESLVQGSMMVVVVANLKASLHFYQTFFGTGSTGTRIGDWRRDDGVEAVRGLKTMEHRSAYLKLPGSTLWLELLQFRISAPPSRPRFQDIGHGHVALYTPDIEQALHALEAAGGHTLSRTGTWTTFSPALRGFYTSDPDGFFLEVIERH